MDDRIKKTHDCYNFPCLKQLFNKHKSISTDPNNHNIKPNKHHIFKDDNDKGLNDNNHMNGVKKSWHSGNGVAELNKVNHKHNHNNCFRAIILTSVAKKKRIHSKVSASDPSDSATTKSIKKIPSRSRSFEIKPSIGRSTSIDNSETENGGRTPNSFRKSSVNRTVSNGNRTCRFNGRNGSFENRSTSLNRSTSNEATSFRKISGSRSGPLIMFSNSSGMLKPPAIEQQLECTLEELCFGCVKHINVYRCVYTLAGQINQEEEVLRVHVKPGWKTGTKITFQGTPINEKPGAYLADVIFNIVEKPHPLFQRNEDNLELEIQIPLVDALTGCTLAVPLLGKETTSFVIDDVIYPGLEKTIVGQGMPNTKKPDHRGDLRIRFAVEYPKKLTVEQQSGLLTILSG